MRLHLYFANRFLRTFLITLFAFVVVMSLIDVLEVGNNFSRVDPGAATILTLVALRMPASLYEILPLVVILAAIAVFINLARSSELVAARSAGRSALRMILAPALTGLAIGMLAVGVLNPIAAASQSQYEKRADQLLGKATATLSVGKDGLWLRQETPDGSVVIRADLASADGTELSSATFFGFGKGGLPTYRVEAETARLGEAAWNLENASRWLLDEASRGAARVELFDTLPIATNLTADQIRKGVVPPRSLPIWELPAFARALEQSGFTARAYRAWFQAELARPFLLLAMVLTGAAFTMRHARMRQTGLMVVLALVFGFGLYFVRNLALLMGENGQVPILLAAWAPPISAILGGIGLILQLEDG